MAILKRCTIGAVANEVGRTPKVRTTVALRPFKEQAAAERFVEGLRRAGLAEH
jgi:hypothetical protein